MNNDNRPTGPDARPTEKIERNFISKSQARRIEAQSQPEPTTPPKQADLVSSLPKEPQELTHDELLDSYYKLALRCFQSESSLDMAKELIKSLEERVVKQVVVIQTLETSLVQSKEVLKSLVIGTK